MRLLILSDANTLTTGRLIRAALALAARRPGTEVCAIVTARTEEFRLRRRVAARRLALRRGGAQRVHLPPHDRRGR